MGVCGMATRRALDERLPAALEPARRRSDGERARASMMQTIESSVQL